MHLNAINFGKMHSFSIWAQLCDMRSKRSPKWPVAPFFIKKNRAKAVPIPPESDKGGQKMYNGKTPKNRSFSGFWSIAEPVGCAGYLLENWGARRAALRPYLTVLSSDFPWYSGLFVPCPQMLPHYLIIKWGHRILWFYCRKASFTTPTSSSGLLYFTCA